MPIAMDSEDPRFLFVYGTLLPGLAPPIIAQVVNRLRLVGAASIAGVLYHLGSFPGAQLAGDGDSLIHGQLLHIPDPALLERLDWYEDFVASDKAGGLFVRKLCMATLLDGREVPAWVYLYQRDASMARRIASGRYDPSLSCDAP